MTTYIGPYAEWLVPVNNKTIDYCKDKANCPNDDEYEFCRQCGLELRTRFVETEVAVNICAEELIKDALLDICFINPLYIETKKGKFSVHRYVPNSLRPGDKNNTFFDHGDSSYQELDLEKININEQSNWFRESYKKELEKLAKEYGCSPIYKYGYLRS